MTRQIPMLAQTGRPWRWMVEWGRDQEGYYAAVVIFGDYMNLRFLPKGNWAMPISFDTPTAKIEACWIGVSPIPADVFDGIYDLHGYVREQGPEKYPARLASANEIAVARRIYPDLGHDPGLRYVVIPDSIQPLALP